MVRWLESKSVLPSGFDFFKREIAQLVAQNKLRVLISGGADTGVLTMVYKAFQAADATPDIVFVDRCKTTVLQNRLLAETFGLNVDLRHCDIRVLECEPVDLVVAHSFLLFFPGQARQQVIDSWARLLRPGGTILMTNSITEDENTVPTVKTAQEIIDRIPLLIEAACDVGLPESQAAELGQIAGDFWRRKLAQRPYITEENLRRGLELAGLTLEQIDTNTAAYVSPRGAFNQSVSTRMRVEVVARKG